jgi:predicted ATPase/DNA-binding winged helix-turn-helix (wHTH) protein
MMSTVGIKQFETFRLDASDQCLWQDGKRIPLPPKPFLVLSYLVANPGRLITHDEILDALWPDTFVQPQVLRTYMLELRKVLGDATDRPRFIETVPKRGYRFIAPVSDGEPSRSHHSSAPVTLRSTLIGRDAEMAALRGEFASAQRDQRRLVFISGEPGIGKTALANEFCDSLDRSVAVLAKGQCIQGFAAREDYYPLVEALRQLCNSFDGELACRSLHQLAPGWLSAIGTQGDTGASSLGRRPGDLCAAIEDITKHKPLVLLLEDLQWADQCTLDLISALGRRQAPASLLIIATLGRHEGAASHALRTMREEILLHGLGRQIELSPLGQSSLTQILSARLDHQTLPSGLDGFLHQRSEGNPLFALALLDHLLSRQLLVRKAANGKACLELRIPLDAIGPLVPDQLARTIELEIERLTPQEQNILEAASLTGIVFPAWLVAAALEQPQSETEEACDALARNVGFVKRAGEDELPDGTCSGFYTFGHALYREVLYQRQASSRRVARHVRIAERLAQLFAGREADVAREIAMHYEAAGRWQLAAVTLRAGAQRARQRHSPSEAADLLHRALRLAESLPEPEREITLEGIRKELAAAPQAN